MRIATFTVTRDEATFLPKWISNSLKNFSPQDIYVLDHQTEDTSAEDAKKLGVNVETIFPPENPDASWFRDKIRQTQRDLLQRYDWVLFSECDEFVIPSPGVGSIKSVAERMQIEGLDFARCTGFDIVHDYRTESPMDFSAERWLNQRRKCVPWFSPFNNKMLYSKPIFSRVPLNWRNGFHDVEGVGGNKTLDIPRVDYLYLIHCHYLDMGETERRHRLRHRSSKEFTHGAQLQLGNDLMLKFDSMLSISHEIPQEIKEIF